MRIAQSMGSYVRKVRRFQPNARLYLTSTVLLGVGYGIEGLLYNFYIMSQGYGEGFLATLMTASYLAMWVGSLPAGFVSDWLGRKRSLVLAVGLLAVASLAIVVWRHPAAFVAMNALFGLAVTMKQVSESPFMAENSSEEERNYLFSLSFGVQTAAGFVGSYLGGNLPTWLGALGGVSPTSATAYGWALSAVAAIFALALVPLLALERRSLPQATRPILAPLQYAWKRPRTLGRLTAPLLVASLGAGLMMPFMNVFYRHTHHQPDAVIGTLFALGSLVMAAGQLIAPPLADRHGKIWLVLVSQLAAMPFLFLLGFSPWFGLSAVGYLVRLTLMNMSAPIYRAYVMEQVEAEARGMVASLIGLSWNFGWVLGPKISGWMQEAYGFGPVFAATGAMYLASIFLYYWFFYRKRAGGAESRRAYRGRTREKPVCGCGVSDSSAL